MKDLYRLQLPHSKLVSGSRIALKGSKSETNRWLILSALYDGITLYNVSNAQDTKVLEQALRSTEKIVDIHHAGTAMRFLTAYFSLCTRREVILTGSERMKVRPISILVEALRKLGADIEYVDKEGFPPLMIKGTSAKHNEVDIEAGVSSQYLTALLLIAPYLDKGLIMRLKGEVTSLPYVEMTIQLLRKLGVSVSIENQIFTIKPLKIVKPMTYAVESDWSSASYYYSLVALSPLGTELYLQQYYSDSLQGDAVIAQWYRDFGVSTTIKDGVVHLKKSATHQIHHFEKNLKATPDIAQTIAVTCLGLGIGCQLSGLHTLKIKETDRLLALQKEMQKLGAEVVVTEDTLTLQPLIGGLKENVTIATYEDHRMAMAFAPLCVKVPIAFENPWVVEKSYPDFWDDWHRVVKPLEKKKS